MFRDATQENRGFRPRGALILAAGASERMGTPKAALAWHGTTLLEYAVEQARLAGAEVTVVVLGPATRHLAARLDGITSAFNPAPETGRSASIRLGAAVLPDQLGAVVVQSVDQPAEASVLAALFAAVETSEADLALPTCGGRRGHPICCAGRLVAELRTVTEATAGLRAVVRQHAEQTVEVPVATDSVLLNLNDAAAYAAARAAH